MVMEIIKGKSKKIRILGKELDPFVMPLLRSIVLYVFGENEPVIYF